MTDQQTSRIFPSGPASTLYVTVPASVVSDSRFPFEPDDDVVVTIADGGLLVRPVDDPTDTEMDRTEQRTDRQGPDPTLEQPTGRSG